MDAGGRRAQEALWAPQLLCTLAAHGILPVEYVDAALTYYVETKHWDQQYVEELRQRYLTADS